MTNTSTVTYTTTEISLTKLVPSPANARRTGAGLGIEALAASIQAHGLLQSLVVRPALDGQGQATCSDPRSSALRREIIGVSGPQSARLEGASCPDYVRLSPRQIETGARSSASAHKA